MGKAVQVPEEGIYNLISQAYHAGGEYQWAREAMVNSIQAHATWVEFGIDSQGFQNSGVARRYVADNGVGMSEEDLRIFLMSFGGGGRKISKTENFGQGFKASCYEWNPYGVIVMSWTKDNPDGRMIWIHLNQKKMRWELKDFEIPDQDGFPVEVDCIAPDYIQELGMDMSQFQFDQIKNAGQGTVFLFLGDRIDRDTVNGDYNRGEDSKRGITKYLNTRFWDIPEGVQVNVVSLEAKAEDSERRDSKDRTITSNDGDRRTLHSRRVKGAKAFIPESGIKSGVVRVKHGTDIEWYLTEKAGAAGDSSYAPSRPFIAVQYDNESYDRKEGPRSFRQFGIPDSLKDRVWLMIKPPKYDENNPTMWGVMPQASRGKLIGKGDAELPWEDWYENFYVQTPREIRSAIQESQIGDSKSNDADRRERLKRTAERLSTRFRPVVLMPSHDGRIPGNPSTSPTGAPRVGTGSPKSKSDAPRNPSTRNPDAGGAGDKTIVNPDKQGEILASQRRKSDGIPDVDWILFDSEDAAYAARFEDKLGGEGAYGLIQFNLNFPMFQSEFEFWANKYPRASQEELVGTVKQVYEDELVSKVMHAHKLHGQILHDDGDGNVTRVSRDNIQEWITPQALTTSVMGLVNVEQRISVLAGSRFGPGTKKSRKTSSS
ncbi:hypothetical protein GS479_07130 [Rhodococcus hoagii]|nr:hypothetical protein [Prescottella equi]